jgi:hypothetical protein
MKNQEQRELHDGPTDVQPKPKRPVTEPSCRRTSSERMELSQKAPSQVSRTMTDIGKHGAAWRLRTIDPLTGSSGPRSGSPETMLVHIITRPRGRAKQPSYPQKGVRPKALQWSQDGSAAHRAFSLEEPCDARRTILSVLVAIARSSGGLATAPGIPSDEEPTPDLRPSHCPGLRSGRGLEPR